MLLQWAIGLPTKDRSLYAGWFVQRGKDEQLDTCAAAAGLPTVTIKHSEAGLVEHWRLDTADLFIIAEGLQSTAEMGVTSERYGVAYWWETTEQGREISQLRARVLVKQLVDAGYTQPLTLTVKSTLTGDVLNAFERVYDMLDWVKRTNGRDLPFYAFALSVSPGGEVQRGKAGAQKEIVPPVAQMPTEITRDWLLGRYVGSTLARTCADLLPATVAWSQRTSAQAQDGVIATVDSSTGEITDTPLGKAKRAAEEHAALLVELKALRDAWRPLAKLRGVQGPAPLTGKDLPTRNDVETAIMLARGTVGHMLGLLDDEASTMSNADLIGLAFDELKAAHVAT